MRKEYSINQKNVKFLGRTLLYEDICWCGLSGSGVTFEFTGTRAEIVFVGDDTTGDNETEGKARMGVYVKDERVEDFMMTEHEKRIRVFSSNEPENVEIRIVKLSESPMSVCGIKTIIVDSQGEICPSPNQNRKIEFIGDSITCGFGVDVEDPLAPFSTDIEDVTKAYAYRVAQKLKADYSMVSYSGYGIISGYTDNDIPAKEQCVPRYYEKIGFSNGHPMGKLNLQDYNWDFEQFQPDLVIVNLGTNDDSYCQDKKELQQEFSKKYVEFLHMVRVHNPQAVIICVVGIMGERIYPAVEQAVKCYRSQTGEQNVYAQRLPEQLEEDGKVACYHPTAATHEKSANLVVQYAKRIMNW